MKRRLFWKILIGFWLTLIIITQGIWLMFTLLRPDQDVSYMRSFARMSVASASASIREGGLPALAEEQKSWPQDWRARIRVRPSSAPLERRAPVATQTVAAPDGVSYRVTYNPQRGPRSHGIFGIPMEVVIVAVVGGLGFSAILAWYLTQPIQRMQAGFGRLAQGNFGTRLGPAMGRRRDEIADLAHDFDKMAVRLQELVAARDRLLADVSHELRTPLARLNLAIGLARQDPSKMGTSLDRISGEAAKLDEMVGELLTLSKLETGQSRGEDYFNFAEIVKAVVQDAGYEAAGKKVEVLFDVLQSDEDFEWIVLGSGKLVSRAVENIVRNAVRYSSEGGKVIATLRHEGERYSLKVTDEGPGIPEEAMASLFMPFGMSADGFGFGLGLAIAQRAVAVHGGTIIAHNRQPKGLEMAVTLPAATVEPS
ncbi:MAG TPA: ATP-binding protein [Rhizomicrobium sp.]|jgi:two-component system OmpR family sensor kinase